MTALFFRIIEFSCYGALWVMLLFLVNTIIGKKTGVLWQYVVTVCIAAHLLIPVHIQWLSVDIPVLHHMSQEARGETLRTDDIYGQGSMGEAKESIPDTDTRDIPEEIFGDTPGNVSVGVFSQPGEQEKSQRMPGEDDSDTAKDGLSGEGELSFVVIAEAVWLLGMLFFFGGTAISYLAFCKQAKRWSLPAKPLADQALEDVKRQYHIGRRIILRRNSQVASPMLYGVIRPVILLPDQEYSRQEYRYIFCHELSHYRHGDVLVKYLFTVCKGVYWFHPLVWWMCRRACAQMEILCDEAVVAGKDVEEKRAYSMVILRHMAGEGFFGRIPLTTSFYGGKDYMKMRFKNIMNTTKKRAGAGVVLAAAVAALILGGVKWSHTAGAQKNGSEHVSDAGEKAAPEKKISSRNILVVGTDLNGTDEKKRGFADAILLVQVDAEEGIIAGRNIPRELLVDFGEISFRDSELSKEEKEAAGEWGEQKLGTAYALYGYKALAGAVEHLYDVKVDSHIILNYQSVPKIIDAAGGVEITLTRQEADYLNSTNYISRKENRNVKPGKQLLNGDQATGYLRIRKTEAGSPVVEGKKTTEKDTFGRTQRCNNVIRGMEKQIRKNKADWSDMIKSLVQGREDTEMDIDLSAEELILLVKKVIGGELKIVIAGTKESEKYEAGFSEEIGSYLTAKDRETTGSENESSDVPMASTSYGG